MNPRTGEGRRPVQAMKHHGHRGSLSIVRRRTMGTNVPEAGARAHRSDPSGKPGRSGSDDPVRIGAGGASAYHRRHFPTLPQPEVNPMTTEPRSKPAAAEPTVARMVIGGESVDAADGQTFDVVNPATGAVIATAPLGGREDVDRAVAARAGRVRRPQGLGELGGRQARPDPGQVRRPGQGAQRGARPAREPERRQADHRRARRGRRREPRLRLLRRRREQGLRPDDPGLEARPRPDPARADRRRRADRAVELPDPDGLVEGRPGARRRQHRDPQARLATRR